METPCIWYVPGVGEGSPAGALRIRLFNDSCCLRTPCVLSQMNEGLIKRAVKWLHDLIKTDHCTLGTKDGKPTRRANAKSKEAERRLLQRYDVAGALCRACMILCVCFPTGCRS